jgi:anti-sigma B factor antagonist
MSSVRIEQIDGVPVARLDEDLDAANAGAIQERLAAALGPAVLALVVDLSGTGYVDSAGIDMLLRLSDRLDRRRARLFLVIPPSSQLKRLFGLVGMPDAIAIHASVDEALAEQRSARPSS